MITGTEIYAIQAPLLLAIFVVGATVLNITFWRDRPRAIGGFAAIVLVAVALLQLALLALSITGRSNFSAVGFGGQFIFDRVGLFFNFLFLFSAGASILLSLSQYRDDPTHRGEYYILIVIAVIGMSLMASAHDFLMLFIGLETMSIPIYILVGLDRKRDKSNEAAVKYLLLGAFGSAILLYGMALLYGATLVSDGLAYRAFSFDEAAHLKASSFIDYHGVATRTSGLLEQVWNKVRADDQEPFSFFTIMSRLDQLPSAFRYGLGLLFLGVGFLFAGLFFKIAAVPFHLWAPDVYEGAPTPITAFMATAVKAAAFAAILRLLLTALAPLWGLGPLYNLLAAAAILTMIVGNLAAIAQTNLKRMLAYSSIAHSGYLLVGVTALVATGQFSGLFEEIKLQGTALDTAKAILMYLLVYTIMNLGAFGAIVAIGREQPGAEDLKDFAGLGWRRPALAAALGVCLLSLIGVPPLAGFTAKLFLLEQAMANRLYLLVIFAVLNSALSAYYYLRVLVVMYMGPEAEPLGQPKFSGALVVVVVMAILLVFLGIYPAIGLDYINQALGVESLALPIH